MDPRSYQDCHDLAATRRRKLANNTFLETDAAPESYGIKLHATTVVRHHQDGTVELDSGGWRTVTTKDRMNRFSPLNVWSDRGVWFVSPDGQWSATPATFADGITWHPERGFSGAGDAADTSATRKRIRKYAADYTAALMAGDVPRPGPGDCLICALRDKDGKPMPGTDHLESHMEESYFVPSLLASAIGLRKERESEWRGDGPRGAMTAHGISPYALGILGRLWSGETVPDRAVGRSLAAEQIEKALRGYLYLQFGV